jgi:hypothetical protein
VVVQARVPRQLADAIAEDVAVLGLGGTSDAIREGLWMLHRRAREVALGREFDEFYGDERAPVSEFTAALYPDDE